MMEDSHHSPEKFEGAQWSFSPETNSIEEESHPVDIIDQTSNKNGAGLGEAARIVLEEGRASARGNLVHFRNEYCDMTRRQEEEEGMSEVVDWENLFEKSEILGKDMFINRRG